MVIIWEILFAGFLLWWTLHVLVHRYFAVDPSNLALFKLLLKHRNIELKQIPDAALAEIAAAKVTEAKAMSARMNANTDDWHAYIYTLLDGEAELIGKILRNGYEPYIGLATTRVLLKHVIVEPTYPPSMSLEQFLDASHKGTLYAELDRRLSQRKPPKPRVGL